MAISCVVEYSEDYGHERFYGITPVKRQDSMGYQGRSPWLVRPPSSRLISREPIKVAPRVAAPTTMRTPPNRLLTAWIRSRLPCIRWAHRLKLAKTTFFCL